MYVVRIFSVFHEVGAAAKKCNCRGRHGVPMSLSSDSYYLCLRAPSLDLDAGSVHVEHGTGPKWRARKCHQGGKYSELVGTCGGRVLVSI